MKYLVLAREAVKQPLPKGDVFDVATISDDRSRSHKGVIVEVTRKDENEFIESVRAAEMTIHTLDKTAVDDWLKNHGLVRMEE